MQIDFHHTVVYVLCRLAGMKSIHAQKVAYVSQQVDDAEYGHALRFENGGIFHQTRTAHKTLSYLKMADVNEAFNVWLPFHFIPSGEGNSMQEALTTNPEGKSIKLLKRLVTNAGREEYALHWLGIFLHLYADSFSHQDFMGFYDKYNQIKMLSGMDTKSFIDNLILRFSRIFPFLFPIGHAVAGRNPDIPFAFWSYRRNNNDYHVNNLYERFLPAVEKIFEFLVYYISKNRQFCSSSGEKLKTLNSNKEKIAELLNIQGSSRRRHQNWLDRINNNYFEFEDFDRIDKSLCYNPRSWFKKAVKTTKAKGLFKRFKYRAYNYNNFSRMPEFISSDWVLFMRTAAVHKFVVLHEVLPRCGLQIG